MKEPKVFYAEKKWSIKTFSSFDEMENDQLKYFASQTPNETLKALKILVLRSFGIREEMKFSELTKLIHLNEEDL